MMDKPISALMERNMTTVDVDDAVAKVEEVLNSHNLTCEPVLDSNGRCFGVISSSDLVRFYALHKNLKAERAREVCTHKVIEVCPDTSVEEAADLMVENKIHHIIVMENKVIKGIVSSVDLGGVYLLAQNA
jgi:CBS domain-containing protein